MDLITEKYLYVYKAFVPAVYDGDTITCEIDLGLQISVKEKIRLLNIDTPELRGMDRELGLIARDALRGRVLDKEILIKTYRDKSGKYGRLIASIYIDGENINEWLVDNGLAIHKEY